MSTFAFNLQEIGILETALINDSPRVMRLDEQPPHVRQVVDQCLAQGMHIVSVRWSTGEFAIMPCPAGSTWPDPDMIVAAYHGCRAMRKPEASDTS